MSTAKSKPPSASGPLPYPIPLCDDSAGPLFWLSCWFIEQAQYEALLRQQARFTYKTNRVLCHASITATSLVEKMANETLRHVVDTGALLFAWAGTTALQAAEAVAA